MTLHDVRRSAITILTISAVIFASILHVTNCEDLATSSEDSSCSQANITTNGVFRCVSNAKRCISQQKVCDRTRDCEDNSDEALCSCFSDNDCRSPTHRKCFKILDKAISECRQCPEGKRFDGHQCQDIDECSTMTHDVCQGNGSCVNLDGGFTCVQCPRGYEPHMHDSRYFSEASKLTDPPKNWRQLFLCEDLNECLHWPCDFCVNIVGSFKCECPPYHAPESVTINDDDIESADTNVVCRATGTPPEIAIANKNNTIFIYDLRTQLLTKTVRVSQAIVDMVAYKNVIFYAYRHQLWQYRISTDFHAIVADLAEPNDLHVATIKRLTVDWENNRVYILTDRTVTLVDFFGKGMDIIEHQDTIQGIAVDPLARLLFYSEAGVVRRAHLDGKTSPEPIFRALTAAVFDRNVQGGEALALDPNLAMIYYVHGRVLYSFNYRGNQSIVLQTQAPYANLEPFEDRLFANYRVDASGLVSLHRIGYTGVRKHTTASSRSTRLKNEVTFHGTRPRAMTVLHVAKFPERRTLQRTSPCFSSEVCQSGWCFPLPEPYAAGHRCVCSRGERDSSCVAFLLNDYRPQNTVMPEGYNAGAGLALLDGTLHYGILVSALAFLLRRL